MEDIMEDNFEKLNLLLEQEQCEFVDIPDSLPDRRRVENYD